MIKIGQIFKKEKPEDISTAPERSMNMIQADIAGGANDDGTAVGHEINDPEDVEVK